MPHDLQRKPCSLPLPPGEGRGEGGPTTPRLTRRTDDRANILRRTSTDAEAKLWRALRDRQLAGAKFRRQAPLGPYIVDFLCLASRLIVELDGGQHADELPSRQAWLEAQGYRVLRFWNNDVLTNRDGALVAIAKALTPALSRWEREPDQSSS